MPADERKRYSPMAKINLLSIGLDITLALPDREGIGDSKKRQIRYSRGLASYHIIVKSRKDQGLKARNLASNCRVYPTSSLSRLFFARDAYRLGVRIIRENRIDVITTQDPFVCGLVGWLLKKRFRLPLCMQVHSNPFGSPYERWSEPLNLLFYVMGRFLIKKADTVRVGTTREKRALVRMGLKEERISVLSVIVDQKKFLKKPRNNLRPQLLAGEFDRIVLFAGRLVKAKDLPTLVRAMPLVLASRPRTLFVIAGKGKEEQRIRDLVRRKGLERHVRFPGIIPHERLSAYYYASDVFALSSIYEGTCLVLIEASLCARPIVATDVSGTDDVMIKDVTGFVVPQRDPARLAEKIAYLLDHPARARKMGQRAREHVRRNFNEEKLAGGLIRMYENAR